MKFLYYLFLMSAVTITTGDARLLSPPVAIDPLSGLWIQAFSSRFVQETTEIDYDCVTINFSIEEGSDLVHYNKRANLHRVKNSTTSIDRTYRREVEDDVMSLVPLSVSSTTFPTLLVRGSKNMTDDDGYVILTGTNNLTLYVLTRNYGAFVASVFYEEVLDLLRSFDYTTYYKFPLSSYSVDCEPPSVG
jgi:hypothetical protein